jgi:hypothetical protein
LEAHPFIQAVRGRQHLIAGKTHMAISSFDSKLKQLIRYGPPDAATSVSWSDKHAGHFAFSTVKTLYRTRTDDFGSHHCTQ